MEKWEVEITLKNGKRRIIFQGNHDEANSRYELYKDGGYGIDTAYCGFGITIPFEIKYNATLRMVK